MSRFDLRFDMYQEEEEKAPTVRYLLTNEVEASYANILKQVNSLSEEHEEILTPQLEE